MRRVLASAKTKLGASGWFRLPVAKDVIFFSFNGSGNNAQVYIAANSSGAVFASRADDSTVYGTTASGVFTAAGWVHIAAWVEAGSTPSATDGKVIIRVGGASGVTLTCNNVDTLTSTNTNYTSVNMMFVNLGEQQYFHMDDFVLNDDSGSYNNAIMDAYRAYPIYPNGDVAGGNFVAASGAGYENLNAAPPTDSSKYIQSNAVSDVSDFEMEDPSYALTGIVGMVTHTRMLTSGSGSIQVSLVNNGSVTSGTTHSLAGSATYYQDVFERNPDGNAQWTFASAATSKIRFTRTA